MQTADRRDSPVGGNQVQGNNPDNPIVTQEKTTLGGDFNSGVTSLDDAERDEIQKKGALANIDQSAVRTSEERRQTEGDAE